MLRVEGIDVFYGKVQALYHVDFEVHEGETVSIIGSNGAGKSTLMKTIMGINKTAKGSIEFKSQKINNLPTNKIVKKGLIYIPEGREIFPKMTVLDNLKMGAYSKRYSMAQMRGKLEEMFEIYPRLKERQSQLAGSLSGGEQQMLADCFGVSRTPVRAALQKLASDGLIYIKPKSGNFVTKINIQNIYNTIYIRNSVDRSIFEDMIQVLKEIDFQKLSINLAKQKIILSKKDQSLQSKLEFMFYDDSFHRDLYAVAGKEEIWDIVMKNQYDYIRQRMFLNRYNLTHMGESVKQHDQIFAMLKERNLEKLILCNREHLYTGVSEAYDFVKMAPDYFE